MVNGLFGIAVYLYVAGVAVLLIWEDRDPTSTLAWLLVLIFLPVVGIPLYLLFGRDMRWRRRRSAAAQQVDALAAAVMDPVRALNAAAVKRHAAELSAPAVSKVAASVIAQGGGAPLPADSVEILASGAEMFDRLIADIGSACDSIHLQYYIWECDDLTGRVIDALVERAGAGVEVRLTHDFIGSLRHSKEQLRRLSAAGATVVADTRALSRVNYRNHRKIVVIDGTIAYTGGFNVGSEYIDGGRRFPAWRDTHLRVTGPFACELQRLFASRWFEVRQGSLFSERYFPLQTADATHDAMLQAEDSAVDSRWEAIRHSYITAIGAATRRVWISSPYFVPDQQLFDAMVAAALAGVDVRLIMTGLPDKHAPWWAAQSYYRRFLEAGGRVHLYTAGFYHPKALSIDSAFCSIGTANIDVRSLELDSEVTVWIYDEETTLRQDRLFELDLASSREVTLEEVAGYSAWQRFRSSLMRLGARML